MSITLKDALEIARNLKYGPVPKRDDPTPTSAAALEIIQSERKTCGFNWLTGEEAERILEAEWKRAASALTTYEIDGKTWTQTAHGGAVKSPSGLLAVVPSFGPGGAKWRVRYRHDKAGEWFTPEPYGWYDTPQEAALGLFQYTRTVPT